MFFEERGYEVVAFGEPVACPVYEDAGCCDKKHPCGDLMITDLEMPRMSGIELLRIQARQGCRLCGKNKAVLSGNLDPVSCAAIRSLGCAAFTKPCRLSTLAAWAGECERRMDLDQPLGVLRGKRRAAFGPGAVIRVGREEDLFTAEVVNQSDAGLCVRLERPLAVDEVLTLQTPLPLPSDRLLVRWTRPDAGGGHLAGMSCC